MNAPVGTPAFEITAASAGFAADTCKRAGALASYGLQDRQIADTLLVTVEQVFAIRQTLEFREAFAVKAQEKQQTLMDLEDGWDAVETLGVSRVLETLKYNVDPRFALLAARTANGASRRNVASAGRVIDASKAGNVIILSMNQGFVERAETGPGQAAINVTPRPVRTIETSKRQSDLPSPKRVAELLSPMKEVGGQREDELTADLERMGVDMSLFQEKK